VDCGNGVYGSFEDDLYGTNRYYDANGGQLIGIKYFSDVTEYCGESSFSESFGDTQCGFVCVFQDEPTTGGVIPAMEPCP